MRSVLRTLFVVAMIAALGANNIQPAAAPSDAEFVTISSQPTNVGDAKMGALAYHDPGAYDRDLATVASAAGHWLTRVEGAVKRPALAVDIDETALSNWEILKRDDFGRPLRGSCTPVSDAPCGWRSIRYPGFGDAAEGGSGANAAHAKAQTLDQRSTLPIQAESDRSSRQDFQHVYRSS
jgi:hypothetical protein